ncbi:MAG: HAD family hydrolase [Bacteroidales bacterium]
MRYLGLACDYDGTLATAGKVDDPTLEALRRLRASGRRLTLVTGRRTNQPTKFFVDNYEDHRMIGLWRARNCRSPPTPNWPSWPSSGNKGPARSVRSKR